MESWKFPQSPACYMSSASLMISTGVRKGSFCLKLQGALSHACFQYCEIHTSGNLASPWVLHPHQVMGFLLFAAVSAEWSNPSITLKLETDIIALLSFFIALLSSFSSGKTAVTTKTLSSSLKTPGNPLWFSVYSFLVIIGPRKSSTMISLQHNM